MMYIKKIICQLVTLQICQPSTTASTAPATPLRCNRKANQTKPTNQPFLCSEGYEKGQGRIKAEETLLHFPFMRKLLR